MKGPKKKGYLFNMEQLDLSDFFKTKEEAIDFSTRLTNVSEKIFEMDFNVEKAISDQVGIQKKDKFITLLRNNNISLDSHASVKEFFDKVLQKISNLPVVSLTVAFIPKDETLRVLSEWFQTSFAKQVLFDIKVDETLIAGALVSVGGKYMDFSIKPKFNEIFQTALTSASQPKIPDKETPTLPVDDRQSIENISFGR